MYPFKSHHLLAKHTTDQAVYDSAMAALKDEAQLRLDQLVVRGVYEVEARNFSLGVWDGKQFLGIRCKFGDRFLDGEEFWTDTDGTAQPYRLIEMLPETIHLDTDVDGPGNPLFDYLDKLKDGGA